MEIEQAYFKNAYEDLVAQSTKIGALYTDLGKETYITFERLVGRFGLQLHQRGEL
jgi:hypothetical protein